MLCGLCEILRVLCAVPALSADRQEAGRVKMKIFRVQQVSH